MDIITAISAGTKALEALKIIRDVSKSFDEATWKAKLAELMSNIADMKMALVEANEKIKALENDKNELTSKVKFKAEKTIYENGFRYEVFDDGNVAEFPFCQNCETGGRYVRISRSPTGGDCFCAACKAHYAIRSVMHRRSEPE